MSNDDEIEKEIQAAGCDAPRLTAQDIRDAVVAEDYHVFPGTTTTVCCLTLRNGFTVIGESASADARNFREDIGRRIARDKAQSKVWMLEGYLLRETLNQQSQ